MLALGILCLILGIGVFCYFVFRTQQIPDGGSLAVKAKKNAGQQSVTLEASEFSESTLCQPRISFDFSTDHYLEVSKSAEFGRYTTRTAGYAVQARLVVSDTAGRELHTETVVVNVDNSNAVLTPSGEIYVKTTDSRTGQEVLVGRADYRFHSFRAPPRTRLIIKLDLPGGTPRDNSKPPEQQRENVGTIGELELQLYRDVADVEAYRRLSAAAPTWGLDAAGAGLLLLIAGIAIRACRR